MRVEFLGTDNLVHFETTGVTSEYCYLHAGLNIRSTSDNTLDSDERSNVHTFNFTHLDHVFLSKLSWHDDHLIGSFEFWRNLLFSINFSALLAHTILGSINLSLLEVKASLLHNDFKSAEVFFFKVNVGVRHVLVNGLGE